MTYSLSSKQTRGENMKKNGKSRSKRDTSPSISRLRVAIDQSVILPTDELAKSRRGALLLREAKERPSSKVTDQRKSLATEGRRITG